MHAHEQHAQQKASLNNLQVSGSLTLAAAQQRVLMTPGFLVAQNHLSGEQTSASVYAPFETDKLLALKVSRLSELSQPGAAWGGSDGTRCLEGLVALAGLQRQTSSEGAAPEVAVSFLVQSSEPHVRRIYYHRH